MNDLTHIDADGNAVMVDVGGKDVTERIAVAGGAVVMRPATLHRIVQKAMKKGDVLTIAQLAGIMGAKRTSDLIPLCHPLPLTSVKVSLVADEALPGIRIEAVCKVTHRTGVEMEALTAVSVAALTIHDMCKAIDREIRITDIRLLRKSGGRSGDFVASDA
ncbi:MAG: cyclic pyranopterin monophosphate synthase MoaC [Geminicoccaceae bacterium]|nr:cyclic pyranopterin monophosphate synthase MoaC [Geminicoccaceae bacterium]